MQLSSQVVEKMRVYINPQLIASILLRVLQSSLSLRIAEAVVGSTNRSRKLRNDIAVTIQRRLSYKTILVAIK